MGLHDKLRKFKRTSPSNGIEMQRRRSSQNIVVPPGQVNEQSLQVWRALPPQIRHDPSMVSFQMENERLRGTSLPTEDGSNGKESSPEDERSFSGSDFLHIKARGHHDNDRKSTDDEGHSDLEPHYQLNPTLQCMDKVEAKEKMRKKRHRIKMTKRVCLMIFWLFSAVVFMVFEEKHLLEKTLEVPAEKGKNFLLRNKPTGDFKLDVAGHFNESIYNSNETENILTIQPQLSYFNHKTNHTEFKDILDPWFIPLVNEDMLDYSPVVLRNITFKVSPEDVDEIGNQDVQMRLNMSTNIETDIAIKLTYNPLIINVKTGTLLAALILLLFYALLIWEVFERTFVAIVCSTLSIAVLACFNDRPNMEEIVKYMDMELLTLLFCMMILVGILTETGVFDYIAVMAYEFSQGKVWPMIYSLCLMTCFVSSFLDNMTTVILMTPVAIRLCEVMSLDPVPVLLGIIVHANIGGSLTPIGDPISIIICSNHFIASNGVTFMKFVAHTIPGVILAVLQSCIYLRLVFRKIESLRLNEPKDIKDLRREIRVWHKAAKSISSFSKDADVVRETLLKKVRILKNSLKRKLNGLDTSEAYVHTLEDLKIKYPIKNKTLLAQACCALVFIIICFFIQSVPEWRTLPLGWVALLGIIALLIILNREDMEHLMHRIEWTTLLFFAAMFVMMECVERLGLFAWIGEITEHAILCVEKKNRLAMAIFIILWMSALASAVLDSIPVTAMMVKVVVSLVAKESLGLPLEPLVWALAFGPCLGGNGTLYGASANVLSAGIAEQHGYKISFTRYLKIVFPMMLGQIAIITGYLFFSHILFEWH
uniref:Citrate transporter-like domain-containing protein n=1 Tax=Stomoxys calcitrans TaxID=35570 RepID=A0A1I8P8M4_STOCA